MRLKKVLTVAGRILGYAAVVLLALLLAANVYRIAAERLFHIKNPTVFGYSPAVVLTGSMSGTIEPNDLIVTRRQAEYRQGDVITYANQYSTVTHRIVQVTDDGYRTKGDANNAEDGAMVLPEQVLGRVVLTVPKIGAVILFLKTPFGLLCMLAALVLLTELPRLIRMRKCR